MGLKRRTPRPEEATELAKRALVYLQQRGKERYFSMSAIASAIADIDKGIKLIHSYEVKEYLEPLVKSKEVSCAEVYDYHDHNITRGYKINL